MIADAGVIERLNKALVDETRSALQYELHAALLANWGYAKLAEHELKEADEERGHFRRYADRLTLLNADLDIGGIPEPLVGKDVPELLQADLTLERGAVASYSEAAIYARGVGDLVTANVFEATLKDEEDHVNWLETQLSAISRLGLPLYLSKSYKV